MSPYEPLYEELPGWEANISDVRTWDGLPPAARSYLEHIRAAAGVPVRLVSVGPERDQIILAP